MVDNFYFLNTNDIQRSFDLVHGEIKAKMDVFKKAMELYNQQTGKLLYFGFLFSFFFCHGISFGKNSKLCRNFTYLHRKTVEFTKTKDIFNSFIEKLRETIFEGS